MKIGDLHFFSHHFSDPQPCEAGDSTTALTSAVQKGHTEVVEALLSVGQVRCPRDAQGMGELHVSYVS